MNAILLRLLVTTSVAMAMAAQAADETVLAAVGDRKITATDLNDFKLLAGKALPADLAPTQRDSALLRALIDKTVLLSEARLRDIEKEPWFDRRLQAGVDNFVVGLYTTAQISEKVSISQEELEQLFRESHRDRALRYAGILVATETEAREVVELAEAGADFGELAKERSLFEKTREQGGDMGLYVLKDETDPPIQSIFQLEVGALSEPLMAPFQGRKHFAVFKILDALPVGLESAIDNVREEVFSRKRDIRELVVIDSLRERYAPEIQKENITAVSQRLATEGFTEELEGMPLCTFAGGEITIGDFQSTIGEGGGSNLTNPSWIEKTLHDRMITSALHLQAAKTLGLHADPRALRWLENQKQDLLISALKKREVDDLIPETTVAEAERFYLEHPEKFLTWETVEIREIMVTGKERAEELKGELEAGADAGELAMRLTTREGLDHHEGLLTLNKGTQFRYGPALFEAARQLTAGDIGGPVELEEGYSVFKVVSRTPPQTKPFDTASQKRAKAYVKIDRYRRSFVEYVRILWEQHDPQVFADYL